MKRLVLASLVAAASSCAREKPPAIPEGPVSWSVSASTTAQEVQVGDDFTYTLTVTHPPGGELVPPSTSELEPFAVLDTWNEETSPVETRLHYRLAAYHLPEELEVASLSIRYRDDAGEIATLTTDPVAVRVVSSLTSDVTDIHDIKEPVALLVPRDWSLWLWLLVAVVATLVAYLIYTKRRREPDAPPVWVAPPIPAHEEAEAALARLRDKELIERGEIRLFYTELTDIVKRYAGRRFDVPYLERTTEEILADLTAKLEGDVALESFRAILEIADLVKFAKQMPERQQASTSLTMAFDLVRDTKPAPKPSLAPPPVEATA